VIFTAKVAHSTAVTPTGQVIFNNGSTTIGNVALDVNGNATLQTSFAATGVYSITAVYSGNGTYAASLSSPLDDHHAGNCGGDQSRQLDCEAGKRRIVDHHRYACRGLYRHHQLRLWRAALTRVVRFRSAKSGDSFW
jgi:Bacterial Ig-like domain (group 3)